jgi:hypothetical protein
MGWAYNTFILQVQSLRTSFAGVTADNATERMPAFVERYRSAVQRLNVAVADLVEASQNRISPTQTVLNRWRRRREEFEQHPEALDVGTDSFDDADDDAYDPTEFIDEDDEF